MTRLALASTDRRAVGKTNGHATWEQLATVYFATAQEYINRGFHPIPQYAAKQGGPKGYPELRLNRAEDFVPYFRDYPGMGLLLGQVEEGQPGLIDVDLDCPEAVALAHRFLPATALTSGRQSNPRSHWFYRVAEPLLLEQFKNPFWTKDSKEHETVVELRGNKADGGVGFTARVFPSKHESGEQVRFDSNGEPPVVDAAQLRRGVAKLAAAALLQQHWPDPDPYELKAALIGTLADLGFTEEETCHFFADTKKIGRHVKRTYELKGKGKAYTAAPKLEELLGDNGRKIVKTIAEWLGPAPAEELAAAASAQFHVSTIATSAFLKKLETALAEEPSHKLFQQGPRILRVEQETRKYDEASPLRRPLGNTFLSPASKLSLERALNDAGVAYKFNKQGTKRLAANAPTRWCEQMLDRARGAYGLPWKRLDALRTVPFLLEDGTLVSQPGYHAATGIWLDLRDVTFPEIPTEPTKEQARSALEKFEQVFCEYKFVPVNGEAWNRTPSYAVVLSTILSILGRNLLPTVPGQGTTAPKPGSGKTDLNKAQAILATGSEPMMMGFVNMKEFDKHVPVPLIEGDRVILIDNVDQMLRSETLTAMLTNPSGTPFQVRLLGQTEKVNVENHAVVMANGNYLQIFGDMERRWFLVDLDPQCESPEEREFEFDPVKLAREKFPELAMAGLTALRYYLHAGCPRPDYGSAARDMGSYSAWNRIVRGLLLDLSFGDPMATRERVKESNPQRQDESALMEGFFRISPRGESFTLYDIPSMAKEPGSVAQLVHSLLCDKGIWNPGIAVWRMRRILNRPIDGKRLVQLRTGHANKTEYRVEAVAEG
jgi:hypothetical protein